MRHPPLSPHVADWPFVRATVTEFKAAVPQMQPLPTGLPVDDTHREGRSGTSVWGTNVGGRRIGIEWSWEIREDVKLVLSNPMALDTNVLLFDTGNRLLGEVESLIQLGEAIRELPWVEHLLSRH
jgi:hypothetical protein